MDNYEKFREILHQHPSGAPKSHAFDEILRILFTPEEVAVALGMVFVPRSAQEIAKIVGVSEDEVLDRCESMANKGIVFSRKKEGEVGYALLPTIPGMFEFSFMTGGGTPMHDRLGKLWMEYHHGALGREFAGSKTPLTRVIPIERTLDFSLELHVLLHRVERSHPAQKSKCLCKEPMECPG